MTGIGLQPAGTSSAGFGTPDLAPVLGGSMLRNTANGSTEGARKIENGDYVMDPDNGRLLGMNQVQQAVVLAVSTELNTSAVKTMGHKLRQIERITPNHRSRCLSVLTAAMQPLVDQNLIAVLGFSTFVAGAKGGLREGQTYGRFRWRDLTTSTEHEETI